MAASVLVTASADAGRRHRRRTGRPAGDHRAPRAGDRGADRASSRPSCWSTTSTPACAPSTPTPPSTWRSRPSTRARWPAGSVRPARFSSAPYSPVSLGDYCAGSNHVLPTAGCARHSSGLSVQTFLRGIHVVDYTEAALKDVSGLRDHAVQGRRPARARRGGPAEVRAMTRRQDRDARRPAAARRPARQVALRRTATGRSGAAEHQREPAPAQHRRWSTTSTPRCARWPPTCTATPTATRWRCAPTWPPT